MYPRLDEASGLYGYWGRDGWAISPQFGYAHGFISGYAAVKLVDGRYGLIGTHGKLLLLDEICGGRTPMRVENFYFTGFIYHFSALSRYAAVCTLNRGRREWGLLDTSLCYRPLPDEVFAEATFVFPYGDYVAVFHEISPGTGMSCGLFNLGDMRLEIPVDYSFIFPSRESLWVVSRAIGDHEEDLGEAFYDPSKREFLPGWFWRALPFSCGFGAIREKGGCSYYVDEGLRPAFDVEFDDVGPFSYGLAAVYKGEDAGYIDTTGQMRLLLPYDNLLPFNEFGLAIANRGGEEWDIIDRTGRPRLAGLEVVDFYGGDFPYFVVAMNDKDHLFDINLNRIF